MPLPQASVSPAAHGAAARVADAAEAVPNEVPLGEKWEK